MFDGYCLEPRPVGGILAHTIPCSQTSATFTGSFLCGVQTQVFLYRSDPPARYGVSGYELYSAAAAVRYDGVDDVIQGLGRTRALLPRGMTRSMTSSLTSSSATPSREVTRPMRSRPTSSASASMASTISSCRMAFDCAASLPPCAPPRRGLFWILPHAISYILWYLDRTADEIACALHCAWYQL